MKNKVEEIVKKYNNKKSYNELKSELDELNLKNLTEIEKHSWFHLRGIIEYECGNRNNAINFFSEGLKEFPKSSVMNFLMGQELEIRGQIKDALQYFVKVNIDTINSNYVMAAARFCYLWNDYKKSNKLLSNLMTKYYSLGTFDKKILFSAGLPEVEEIFYFYMLNNKLLNDYDTIEIEFKIIKDRIKNSNEKLLILRNIWEASISENWDNIINDTENKTGYNNLKFSIFNSRKINKTDDALDLINKVVLTEQEFSWLENVRDYARYEIFAKNNEKNKENFMIQRIFKFKPILLEPNLVFDFNFIEIQENLKKIYQNNKTKK